MYSKKASPLFELTVLSIDVLILPRTVISKSLSFEIPLIRNCFSTNINKMFCYFCKVVFVYLKLFFCYTVVVSTIELLINTIWFFAEQSTL